MTELIESNKLETTHLTTNDLASKKSDTRNLKIKNDAIADLFDSPDYKLLEKIGEGGFSSVYRARQINTDQIVAIKILTLHSKARAGSKPELKSDILKNERYIERFERETLLCSRLKHPNIVYLLDKGKTQQGDFFAVFEYVEGLTLKDTLLFSGPFTATETCDIMSQVLDALAHAHSQGVIHRDLKPENIMLTKAGTKTHAKVLDFGIGALAQEARQLDYKSLTLTKETLGTPSYSAPEQLRGEPPTPKTDLYVWGLVFLECLTACPAVSGSTLASIFHKQLRQSNIPLPSALVGHPIAALLNRVLVKKAHERTVTAEDIYAELISINFSNLVGEIKPTLQSFTDNIHPHELDRTKLLPGNTAYTGLTERKQITALSLCLNVHSVTEEPIDYEVVDALYRDQKNQCIDTAIRYGAFHVGSLGESLLFYFGYPMVSDNDIRLCARTALDIVSSLNKRNALLKVNQGIELTIRIGMHTGLVTCYADATPEGDTPNIAMQLVRKADQNQILCSDASQKLLENHIEFKPVQPCILGLDATKTPLFSLTAERQVEAFGFLRSTQRNHAFIGRERELKQLAELITSTKKNKKNIAHVYGEAGIGKSRLVYELRNTAHNMRHYVAQCLPEHQNNALYPILNIVKYQYSLEMLTPSDGFECLNQAIQQLDLADKIQGLAILCTWLNLPLEQDLEPSALSPQLQKQVLFDTVIALLTSQSSAINPDTQETEGKQRNLFIFEDMHWADPTSLEFVNRFLISLDSTNDVLISTSRQALPESLVGLNVELIEVNKLTHDASAEFISTLFDNEIVSKKVLDVLVSRTDGIPLFIEELIAMLKQKALVHKLENVIDFVNSDKLDEVPNSLKDSLQQKLDLLVYAKETAQLAATIGREFRYDLLVAASNDSESQIQSNVDELIEVGIIYPQRKVGGDSYIFGHALVRDAAYESMDSKTRKYDHKQVANVLVRCFPETVNKYPSEVARHFAGADSYEQAISYGTVAANASLENYSLDETVHQANKVNGWNENIETDLGKPNEIEINRILLQALMLKHGWGHEEVYRYIDRSKQLFQGLKTSEYSKSVVWTLVSSFVYYFVVGQKSGMIDLHKHVKEIIKGKNDPGMMSAAYIMQGFIYFNEANFDSAVNSYSKVIELYDTETHKSLVFLFGIDMLTWAKSMLGIVFCYQGKTDQAHSIGDEAIAWAKELQHMPSICIALLYRSIVFQFNSEKIKTKIYTNEIIKLSNNYGLPAYKGYASLINLWAKDNIDANITRNIVIGLREMNCNAFITYYASLSADALIKQGEITSAIQVITGCLSDCHTFNEYSYEAELYRLRACYILQTQKPNFVAAKDDLKKSIELSHSRNNQLTLHQSTKHLNELYDSIN